MDDKDGFVLVVISILVVLMTGSVVSALTKNNAIDNCVRANYDWTVANAHAYCNSIIREGKRP